MLELAARELEPAELTLEVGERNPAARGSADDFCEEDEVRSAAGLLGDLALERGQGIVEQRLPPLAFADRHPGELVAALLREPFGKVDLVRGKDVHAKAPRCGNCAA